MWDSLRVWARQTSSKVLMVLLAFSVVENLILFAQLRITRQTLGKLQDDARFATPDSLIPGDVVGFLRLKTLDGKSSPLILKERKYYAFIFSTSCPACSNNLPNWKEIETSVGSSNVIYLSLDDLKTTSHYAQSRGIANRAYVIAGIEEQKRLKLYKIPQTLILRDGIVVYSHVGVLSKSSINSLKSDSL